MTEAIFALDLDAVNAMDSGDFVAALGSTFEHAPWVAEGAWASRPFASLDALHAAMMDVVRGAPRGTQVAFLCGHPELAGQEAQAGTMTSESVGEQCHRMRSRACRNELKRRHLFGERHFLNVDARLNPM